MVYFRSTWFEDAFNCDVIHKITRYDMQKGSEKNSEEIIEIYLWSIG